MRAQVDGGAAASLSGQHSRRERAADGRGARREARRVQERHERLERRVCAPVEGTDERGPRGGRCGSTCLVRSGRWVVEQPEARTTVWRRLERAQGAREHAQMGRLAKVDDEEVAHGVQQGGIDGTGVRVGAGSAFLLARSKHLLVAKLIVSRRHALSLRDRGPVLGRRLRDRGLVLGRRDRRQPCNRRERCRGRERRDFDIIDR